jgi:hypothetical protein
MSSHNARVSLRYRPGADVLSGQIDLGEFGAGHTVTESPDADSTMVWATAPGDPDGAVEYLASFQFVHASARLDQDTLPLAAGLTVTVRTLVETARETIAEVDNPLAKVRARAETSTELALDSLRRSEWPERPPGRLRADGRQTADVSSSLARLADAVHQRGPVDNEPEAIRTDQLSRLLRELSSTISYGQGRTAPGTSAATLAAVRGGIPLTIGEQRVLEEALGDLDDPVLWHQVPQSLDQLSASLEQPRPPHHS